MDRLGGTVVKFTGDGYLITFPSATSALHAATQIIERFPTRVVTADDIRGCRIAVHTCDVPPLEPVELVVRLRDAAAGYDRTADRRLSRTAPVSRGDSSLPDLGIAGPLVTGAFRQPGDLTVPGQPDDAGHPRGETLNVLRGR
ncbi:hypothetical protein [Actinoplanes sp. NPDC051494]|uniref:hypothetical protein n=1 Tax=Actinoplanes sp. NPDC051494 TaxID=3363907 RepID=UPI0037A38AE7